jgi:RNA recognition motif-containing protein
LEDALSKLSANDAAIVKAALMNKGSHQTTKLPDVPEETRMRSILLQLGAIDAERIVMVRKIDMLGFKSPQILRTYFSKFGPVETVLIPSGKVTDPDDPSGPKVRPSGYGFIVMEKVEDVTKIFTKGLEHTLFPGKVISLTAYEHHDPQRVRRDGKTSALPETLRAHRFPNYANISFENTLVSHFRKMSEIDAKRIFMVRKISKLGFGSAQLLKTRFSEFGAVENVFVTHSIDSRKVGQPGPYAKPSVKPAGIGFVVMEKEESVHAAFQKGLDQNVYGVSVCLGVYEHYVCRDCQN